MKYRSVLIFPDFNSVDQATIQSIRQKNDSLYTHIRPHVSLVFPFKSNASDTIICDAVQSVVKQFELFTLTLNRVEGDTDNGYVWLSVAQGADIIKMIHDKLYELENFKPFYRCDIPYQPHVTIGQSLQPSEARQLVKTLNESQWHITAKIECVAIENILANDDSAILASFELL
ncbi:2'-5' RNA ligase family protein [Leuconostoc falkenbergense]|uniref:2'-5' RNA ligase family protein n=1 Tax=Leuconostoc falkenbergense TaxID=2766470 RepID=UPI0024AD2B3E|nr:2'-5' RNA ligase family protein [Leuconostoc falkenbergense]MDI6666816.1 2'-5' RNA ligase family protein [Leuconostoc falkenbergense]